MFSTVVNTAYSHCNCMKSVFQIKFYLTLYVKNGAGLLHMTQQFMTAIEAKYISNCYLFFLKFQFQISGLLENTRMKSSDSFQRK